MQPRLVVVYAVEVVMVRAETDVPVGDGPPAAVLATDRSAAEFSGQ